MSIARLVVVVFALACVGSVRTWAQLGEGQSVDKIVAVAGNEVVLLSDVQTQMALLAQQDPALARTLNDSAMGRRIIDALINEKLILAKAIEDSVEVTDEEITERLEFQIRSLAQQLGSEKRIEEVYGMSLARIRRDFRDEIRKQMLIERKRQQKFFEIKPSQREVEEFFAEYRDSLPPIPAQYELYHIVKYVEASSSAKDDARLRAKRVRDSILSSGSFADFARRYSADVGSAASGGELGFVEKGKLVPEYEKVAYALQPNEISDPVETPFGFHIIQLIEKRATSVNTRHILFKVGQSNDDVERVKAQLNALRLEAISGKDFQQLAKENSDDDESKAFGGSLGEVDAAHLGELKGVVDSLADGGISEPLPYAGSPTKVGFRIVYRKALIPEHPATLAGDFKRIEQYATLYKRNKLYEAWVQELRKTMYWEIKDGRYK